jgi:hypothetical protein
MFSGSHDYPQALFVLAYYMLLIADKNEDEPD